MYKTREQLSRNTKRKGSIVDSIDRCLEAEDQRHTKRLDVPGPYINVHTARMYKYIVQMYNVHKNAKETLNVKGSLTRDFRLQVYFMNQIPQVPDYTYTYSSMRAISNFYRNSRIHWKVKVNHRCQRHRRQIKKI
jgi:hypothetical protein